MDTNLSSWTLRADAGRMGSPAMPLTEPLTPREREVLDCLSRKMMDKEIADSLKVSINTVKHHLRNIYSKFGVGSRRRAVEFYLARV
ncbi:helix-turn-helix transcriptional regulator [Solimonas sp. SE-A11]|uniref:helix-turn-helix domain-containing protein n=1 Tax=Solimonas sp. SE-A11 TaxID=3054954 RepID=UPI00259D0D5E|nr:helix-turn-helix transcriptional regulator [Solimonas sp. SE-A11]MDM4771925.1 helix-turn-helix transcriptional regulator [Solimonas sp. SE-A11]